MYPEIIESMIVIMITLMYPTTIPKSGRIRIVPPIIPLSRPIIV